MDSFLKLQIKKVVSFFSSYWFARNGYISVEAGRIFLALTYLYINQRWVFLLGEEFYSFYDVNAYKPIGWLLETIFPKSPPSIYAYNILINIAYWSPFLLLFGILSRSASIVVFISNLLIRSLQESFTPDWSHGFNVIFLTHLAFLFAPVGQLFSIDYLIKKYVFKTFSLEKLSNGFWAVLLANWAVACMFFNAFYWKIFGTHRMLTFEWAFSDNLRNQILTGSLYVGDAIPERILWVVENEWAFKGLAAANLFFQGFTILSVFFVKKPLWRFFFGLIFVVEEIGLSYVMDLRDYQWFPLLVFFIDWDALFGKLQIYKTKFALLTQRNNLSEYIYLKRGYIITYLFIYLFIAFGIIPLIFGKSHFALNTYPFSCFAMHSEIRASKGDIPFRKLGAEFEIDTKGEISNKEYIENRIKRRFYSVYAATDSLQVKGMHETIFNFLHKNKGWYEIYNGDSVTGLRSYRVIYEFSKYPNKPSVEKYYRGLIAQSNLSNTFKFVDAEHLTQHNGTEFTGTLIKIKQSGYKNPHYKIYYTPTFNYNPKEIEGKWIDDNTFLYYIPYTGFISLLIEVTEDNTSDIYMPKYFYNYSNEPLNNE